MMVRRLTGKHILLMLIAFFGVIFAINGAFIYYAVHTWSGLDIDNSFIHGLTFDEDVKEAHDWRTEVNPVDLGNGLVKVNVIIERVDGRDIEPYSMDAEIRRPVSANDDQHVQLTQTAPHRYFARVTLDGRGQWLIRVRGRNKADEVLFRVDKRLYLKP